MRRNILMLWAAMPAAMLLAACQQMPGSPTTGTTSGTTNGTAYRVETGQSEVRFVTTKAGLPGAGGVTESSRFTRFAGNINAGGKITLDIDLTSVNTGIEIRDERVRTMLFNVKAMPQASFSAQLDPALMSSLPAGTARDIDLQGSLTLANQTRPVVAQLRWIRQSDGSIQAWTRAPIVVDAAQYGLKPGVEALREIVGLNFLSTSAPVSLALVLRPER